MTGRPSTQLHPKTTALLAAIWLLGISLGYYLIHSPSVKFSLPYFGLAWMDLLATGLVLPLAGGLGARLLPAIELAPLARMALRAAFGLGILAVTVLILGSNLGLSGWLAWGGLLIGLILCRSQIMIWLADLSGASASWRRASSFERIVLLLIALTFLAGLFVAIAPPLKYDALAYHLALPEHYIEAGRIFYVDENAYWGFPQLPHMLTTWTLALGARTGALMGWAFGLLAVTGLAAFVGERLGRSAGLVSAAALLAGSSLSASLAWAYVDWPTILMAWATIATLWLWQGSKLRRWLLVASLFAGFAFGSKYTAGLVALLAVVYILVEERRPSRSLAWFSLTALLAAAPWLLKNMLATTNPFYPLLLPGGAMDEIRLRLYQGFPPQVGWLDTLGLPLRATLWGIEGAHLGDAPGYEASIGPLLLGLGVFAGLGRAVLQEDNRALLRIAAIFSLGGLLLWALAGALSGHLIRTHLYYSLFAAFAILAGFAYAALMRLPRPRWRFDLLLQGLVVLALASGTVGALGAAWPTQGEAQYLRENLGLFAIVMDYLDEDLPDDARILMLWEARGYYCQPKCDSDELIDRWQHNVELLGSSEGVVQAWRSDGYSHVLYHRQAAEFVYEDPEHFHPFDLPKLEAGLDRLELIENLNNSYLLYSLEE